MRRSLEAAGPLRLRLRERNAPSLTASETTATNRLRLVPRSGRYGVDGRGPKRLRAGSGKWIAACAAEGAERNARVAEGAASVGRKKVSTGRGSWVIDGGLLMGRSCGGVLGGGANLYDQGPPPWPDLDLLSGSTSSRRCGGSSTHRVPRVPQSPHQEPAALSTPNAVAQRLNARRRDPLSLNETSRRSLCHCARHVQGSHRHQPDSRPPRRAPELVSRSQPALSRSARNEVGTAGRACRA